VSSPTSSRNGLTDLTRGSEAAGYLWIVRGCAQTRPCGRHHRASDNLLTLMAAVRPPMSLAVYWRRCRMTSWLTVDVCSGESLVCDWSTPLVPPIVVDSGRSAEMFQSSWRWKSRSILSVNWQSSAPPARHRRALHMTQQHTACIKYASCELVEAKLVSYSVPA